MCFRGRVDGTILIDYMEKIKGEGETSRITT